MDGPFAWAVLKGRANYLCRQRLSELEDGHEQQHFTELTETEGEAAASRSTRGASATSCGGSCAGSARTTSGDRADLPFEPSPRAWSTVSVGPRECPARSAAPRANRCFAERARDAAEAADVVVVNTHLYGSHLAAGGSLLPPHDVVVFDEAHELEEVMTASLGVELTPGRFRASRAWPLAARVRGGARVAEVAEVAERMQGAWSGGHPGLHVGTGPSLGTPVHDGGGPPAPSAPADDPDRVVADLRSPVDVELPSS